MNTQICPRCKSELPDDYRLFPGGRKRVYCKQCFADISRGYKSRNHDRLKELRRVYREKENAANVARRRKNRLEAIEHYGGNCACCGEQRIEFLAIDHINGGGGEERRSINYPDFSTWLRLRGWPDGYRVLCHNCNMSMGLYGYCPHKTEGVWSVDLWKNAVVRVVKP
jgi:hypothetical protein